MKKVSFPLLSMVLGASLLWAGFAQAQSNTQNTLDFFKATSSPFSAITTRISGKDLYIPFSDATTSSFGVKNLTGCDVISTTPAGDLKCGSVNVSGSNLFNYVQAPANAYLTPTSTAVGLLTVGSSTFPYLTSIFSTSTQATTTYLSSTLASTSNLTISNLGNISTNCLQVTNQGVVSSTGAGCVSASSIPNVPNNFTYTQVTGSNTGNNYLTPTSTAVGLLTVASSTISNLTSILSTSTQATTTYLNVSGMLNVSAGATSTFANGLKLTAGCLLVNNSCVGTSTLQSKLFVTVSGSSTADYQTSGSNDQVVVQQAVDDVIAAGGGTVYIKSGTYNFSAAVTKTLTAKDIVIAGDGLSTKIYNRALSSSHSNDLFGFTCTNNQGQEFVQLKNIQIIGNSTGGMGIYLVHCYQGTLENIRGSAFTATAGWGVAIDLNQSIDFTIINPVLTGNSYSGLQLENASNANNIIGGWLYGNLSGGTGARVISANKNTFNGTIFETNTDYGAIFTSGRYNQVTNCWIENNSIAGIYIDELSTVIQNCWFTLNTLDIDVRATEQDALITQNRFNDGGKVTLRAGAQRVTLEDNINLTTLTDLGATSVNYLNNGNGRYGIGTSTPYSLLSVTGTTTAAVFEATTSAPSLFFGGYLATGSSTAYNLTMLNSTTTNATTTNFYASGFTNFADGLLGNGASSTILNLTMLNSTTTNATTTNLRVGNTANFGGQLLSANGTVSAPAYSWLSFPSYGTYFNSSAGMVFVHNGVENSGLRSNAFVLTSPTVLSWSNTSQTAGTMDIGISRLGAGKFGFGNGVANNVTGTIIATSTGLGTTSPFAKLSISASTSSIPFAIATTTTTFASSTLFMVDQAGDIHLGGGTPTLSSCGTAPTLDANSTDQAGTITFGASASGCTLTFSTPKASIPHCVWSTQAVSLVNAITFSETASAITFTQAASGGVKFDYICALGH